MKPLSSMLTRIATGVVLVVLLATGLMLGGQALFALFVAVALLALCELYAMLWKEGGHVLLRGWGLALGAVVMAVPWFFPQAGAVALPLVVLLALLTFLFCWAANAETRFADTGLLLLGVCYVPLLLAPALTLSLHEQIFLIGTTVISDTAAYFVGMRYGTHKIWPRVSPKKSVEGSLAGLLGSVLWAVGNGLLGGVSPLALFVGLGVGLGVLAQLGDFCESAIKRACEVKDSGTLLPGHGGMLDRIDSLLFVVPGYACLRVCCAFFG